MTNVTQKKFRPELLTTEKTAGNVFFNLRFEKQVLTFLPSLSAKEFYQYQILSQPKEAEGLPEGLI